MAVDPLLLYHIAEDIRVCAQTGLATTNGGVPQRNCTVPGQIAYDDCCDGQLSVSVTRVFQSTRFPAPDTDASPCGSGLTAIEITVVILRCVPSQLTQEQLTPTCEELDTSAQLILEDAYAIRRSVGCCLRDMPNVDSVMGETTFIGPEGGCGGSQLTLVLGLNDSCFCEGF